MLSGFIDHLDRDRLSGWATDPVAPHDPVRLEVLVDDLLVATIRANGHRPDVVQAGRALSERCGFQHVFARSLAPDRRHVVTLRQAGTGQALTAPVLLDPAGIFDESVKTLLRRAVEAADDSDLPALLAFLHEQRGRLARRIARLDSGAALRDADRLAQARDERTDPVERPRRALVIDGRAPDRGRDAGSQAILSHMQALRALGYDVSFMASDVIDGLCPSDGRDKAIHWLGAPAYGSVEDLLRLQQDSFDLVYFHRELNATRYLGLARRLQRRARLIYGVADLHGVRVMRQGGIEGRPELVARGRVLLRDEIRAAQTADVTITHSHAEAALLGCIAGVRATVVPWAVPVGPTGPDFAGRRGLLFVGNYAHAPNRDAARWLVEAIMPIVRARDARIVLTLAGADMPADIASLASDGVVVAGAVAEMAPLYRRARIAAAPLRYGAGVKGKVLESFAASVPCLMTRVAAEGIGLPSDLDALVVDGAEAFATAILALHDDASAWKALRRSGRAFVKARFAASNVRDAMRHALVPLGDSGSVVG